MIIWLTGLPAAGKTTLAQALAERLDGAVILDGDALRTALYADALGFSKADRDGHVARVGRLALMLEAQGLTPLVALVSPYREARDAVRAQAQAFIEVWVDTPLDTCRARDFKGTYQRQDVTGAGAPYEEPLTPEVHVTPASMSVSECANMVLQTAGLAQEVGPYSLFIGRWQPFHAGHQALIESVLAEGKPVCVAIRDTQVGLDNPFTVAERRAMIHAALPQVRIITVPDIAEVCIGRKVGYAIRELHLDADTEAISGTAIREAQRA